MAIFGNVYTTWGQQVELTDVRIHGHFDPNGQANIWDANVPACIVTKLWVYLRWDGNDSVPMKMAIYDASDPDAAAWTLEAVTQEVLIHKISIGPPNYNSMWISISCNLALTAGKKALAIIAYDIPYNYYGLCMFYYYADITPNYRFASRDVPTEFNDPLDNSIGVINHYNWSMYAEYTEISPTTDTTTITSNARIVDPLHFEYAEPTSVTSKIITRNYNTFDIKLKHTCSHYLNGSQYTLSKCPRCLGTGYYYDAKFNEMGRLVQISLEDKLQQALEKLVLTDENKFHTDVAIGLKKWLGEVPISKIKAIIKYDLMEGVITLKNNQKRIDGLSPRAQISSIDNITVTVLDIDSLHYVVTITTVSGESTNLEGVIRLSDINSN